MNRKKLLENLNKEKKNLGQCIMALSNSLYFDDDMPAKDLVREQLNAMDDYLEALEARITDLRYDILMDDYFEALEARITDLRYDILMDGSLDPEVRKAFDEAEENTKKKKVEPNFLDGMFNDLNSDLDEMLEDLRKRCHNFVGDKQPHATRIQDLEGREIINTNPPHCHECENDGTGCVKIILPGGQHICAK